MIGAVIKGFFFGISLTAIVTACHYGTGARDKIITPPKFLNDTAVNDKIYKSDSIKILAKMRALLEGREQSFFSDQYFDSTELFIDTILYNNAHDRFAVLLLTKNSTSRLYKPEPGKRWYYNATCYLGIRINDSIALSWIGPISIIIPVERKFRK